MLPIDLEERLSQFEMDWNPGQFVELAKYLEDVEPTYRLEMVTELIMIDLEFSIHNATSRDDLRLRLLHDLDQFPELRNHHQLLAKIKTHYNRLFERLSSEAGNSEITASDSTTVELSGGIHPGFELPCRFGKYELLSVLGRGGMGVVYEAQQVRPTRRVAVKIVHPHFNSELESAERFTREIELASQMDDTGVVSIYESGVQDGLSYYVMPICRGGTLRSKIQEGPLSPREAAALLADLARTLSIAHSRNVVHRDIQPGNILFDGNGRTLIADFGLSKHLAQDQSLTVEGQIFGCPGYVPPERILNIETPHDERLEDLYSLGALLYFVLCGRPPYMGRNRIETFTKAMAKPPVPIGQQNPDVDRDLETLCMKAMALRPEDRYASCSDFADDLCRYLNGESIRARRPSWVQRSRIFARQNPTLTTWLVIVPCLLVMALGLFGFSRELTFQKIRSQQQAKMNEVTEYHRLLAESDSCAHEQKPGWIDASTRLIQEAMQFEHVDKNEVVLREKIAMTALRRDVRRLGVVAENVLADAIAFDPQGQWLAVGQNKDLNGFHVWFYPVDEIVGSTEKRRGPVDIWIDNAVEDAARYASGHKKPNDGARSIAFSPDGTRFAVGTRHGRVHVFDWDGENAKQLATFNPGPDIEVFQLQFSPFDDSLWARLDNKSLFVIQNGEVSPFLKTPVEFEGEQLDHRKIREFALSPTEAAVFFIREEHTLYRMNLATFQVDWAYKPLGEQEELKGVAVTPDGRGVIVKLEMASEFDFVDSELGERCYSTSVPQLPKVDSPIRQEIFLQGRLMLTTSYERIIRVWDVSNGQVVTEIYVPERQGCPRIAATQNGAMFAVTGANKVTLYKVVGDEVLRAGPSSKLTLFDFALDEEGKTVATVGRQDSRTRLGRLESHTVQGVHGSDVQFEYVRSKTDYREDNNAAFVTWLDDDVGVLTAARTGPCFAAPLSGEAAEPVPLDRLVSPAEIQWDDGNWMRELAKADEASRLRIQPKQPNQNSLRLQVEIKPNESREISGWHDCYLRAQIDGAEVTGVRYKGTEGLSIRRPTLTKQDGMANIWIGRHKLRKGESFELFLQFSNSPSSIEVDGIWFDSGAFAAESLQRIVDDAGVVASAFHSETGRLWSILKGRMIRVLSRSDDQNGKFYQPQVFAFREGADFDTVATSGPFVFAGGRQGDVATFDSESMDLIHQSVPQLAGVRAIIGLADRDMVVAYENGMVSILDAKKHRVRQHFLIGGRGVTSLCFDPERGLLFAGTSSGNITIFRKVENAFMQRETLRPDRGAIRKIEIIPEEGLLVILFQGNNSLHYLDLNKLESKYASLLSGQQTF